MQERQIKSPTYNGDACLLYDYMILQDLTEEDVLIRLGAVVPKAQQNADTVKNWIHNPSSIPFEFIPLLCGVLHAPLEAVFLKSVIGASAASGAKKNTTLSSKLKHLRKESGETQIEIARLLGLKTASAYSKKENGSVPISLVEAKILAKHFNQPIEVFIREF